MKVYTFFYRAERKSPPNNEYCATIKDQWAPEDGPHRSARFSFEREILSTEDCWSYEGEMQLLVPEPLDGIMFNIYEGSKTVGFGVAILSND
jgi:hypothetical protein